MKFQNVWNNYDKKQMKELEALNQEYIDFISECKTERECTDRIVAMAEEAGYRELETVIAAGKKLKAGDKIYAVWMNKSVCLFQLGKKPLTEGINILGAHIDSPRMDLKSNPLFEKQDIAYLDTHYYGGIKKYQWVTLPLALHGVIIKKDGTTVEVNIGEDPDDPVFFVSDLLIHLAADQLDKKAAKVIEGEALDVIVGSKPLSIMHETSDSKSKKKTDKEKAEDGVKAGVLDILKLEYGVEEEDFYSAEIEVVPAGRAREAGFDRSIVLGYGQDDRVCAFTSLKAMLDTKSVDRTMSCILVDKEEIGSVGATGMHSHFFENAVAELLNLTGQYSDLNLRRTLARSAMLSSDVSAAYDPSYAASFEEKNAAYLNGGMVFNKYTGSRGKSGSNDANAEYLARVRKCFDDAGVDFQLAELGKVDQGGGGTIAYIVANYGAEVVDCGVALLSMHAPYEVSSKADVYEAMKAYRAFYLTMDRC